MEEEKVFITKALKAILVDDAHELSIILQSISYYRMRKMRAVAICFHSSNCIAQFGDYMSDLYENPYKVTELRIACATDNVDYIRYKYCHMYDCRSSCLQLAIDNKSERVKEHILSSPSYINGPVHEDITLDTYFKKLMQTRTAYLNLNQMWEMESYNYENVIQWMPREILEDQLELCIHTLTEEIYCY